MRARKLNTLMGNIIRFYTTKDEHGYLSNFYRAKIECFGRTWMTSEHAYQAQKFAGQNQEDYDAVHNAANPMGAAVTGRDPNRPVRPDWDRVKVNVMRFVVMHKFLQNPELRAKLVTTGDATLVEHDTKRNDSYWGDGGDGTGKNMLGTVLMEAREILRGNEPEYINLYLASLNLGDL